MADCNNIQLNNPSSASFSAQEMLSFLEDNGMISVEDVETMMMKKMVEKTIKDNHPYEIYKSKDGRWNTYIKDADNPRGRKRIVKTDLEDLMNYLYNLYNDKSVEQKNRKLTLTDLYPDWLEYKALHTDAPTYIRRIERDWRKYYQNTPIARIPICKFDFLTLDKWAHNLVREHGLTKRAYFNCTIIMRQVLNYAIKLGIINSNPFSNVSIEHNLYKKTVKKSSSTEVFSVEEEKAIKEFAMEAFNTNRHKYKPLVPLAVLFQFQTGLRVGELCALKYEDITPDGKKILVQRMIRHETKEVVDHTKGTFGDRLIPLTDEAIRLIDLARNEQLKRGASTEGYIFSLTDAPLKENNINRALYAYCDELGFVRKSSHKTRKTVISTLIDSGMNIDTIRRYVGHSDEKTTFNSYCYDRRTDSENIKLLNSALL